MAYLVGFMAALLLAGCAKEQPKAVDVAPATLPKVELVDLGIAPPWTLTGLDGKPVSLSDYRGKVVIIDFWATYCPPCLREIPHYIELQKEYGDKGLVIVGLSADRNGPLPVASFAHRMGVNYPMAMLDYDTAEAYNIGAIPAAFVVDREGRIRFHKEGYASKETMEAVIKPLL